MDTDKNGSEVEIVNAEGPQKDRVWLIGCALVTLIATFMRFAWLSLKPLHHDEGVNGFFLTNLVRDGVYKYDPANYHGPTLYYLAYPFVKLFGLETYAIRASVAIFGVLTVVLALFLKRYLGRNGTLLGALFLALSPGMVFISRYFIHEIFFVFLSLAIVVSVLFFIEKRRAGYFATGWMVLILLVCFLPSGLRLAEFIGGDNTTALWSMRIAFFIVESVLVYFVVRMILTWDEGRPVYLLLASASAALMFATKETAFITLGTMAIACFSIWIWRAIRQSEVFEKNWFKIVVAVHALVIAILIYSYSVFGDMWKWMNDYFYGPYRAPENFVFYSIIFMMVAAVAAWVLFVVDLRRANETEVVEPVAATWTNFRQGLGQRSDMILAIAAVATVFVYLSILFFTSFFTYAEGVSKAFEAYAIWTKTGNKDHTQNGLYAYLKWGMRVESPILIFSALGALVALIKGKNRVAMFVALWAIGLFAAYSIIPYKTPWLALSYLLPMCIIAGYGLGELISSKNLPLKWVATVMTAVGIAVLSYQSYQIAFVRYDDEEMGYVYAHTKRQVLEMVAQIDHYAEKSGKGKDATVEYVTPDYWPLTWYMLKYSHANFNGALVDASTSEMIVAKKNDQDAAVIQRYSAHYKYVGVYQLRPGVDLVLLVRKDLAEPQDQELYKITEYKTK